MSKDQVIVQKRKYKVPDDNVFTEFKEHLFKLKHRFLPRYYEQHPTIHSTEDFDLINILPGKSTITAKHKTIGKYYTIKIIPKNVVMADKRLDELKDGKRIALAVRFSFILHMEFCFKDNANIYFVYPYTTSEDIFSLLKRIKVMEERNAKFYGAQVLLGLEYFHNLDIIYRNIKPENIYLTSNGYIKLANFSFAKIVPMRTYSFCGTPEYMAPEMMLNKGYGKWVDWWAFGVLLYELIAGRTPFTSSDPMKVYENVLLAKLKFNKNFSDDAKNLISNILDPDLSKRYGNLKYESLDIKCHDWFEVIDWQKIYSQTTIPPYYPETHVPVQDDPQDILNIIASFKNNTCEYEEEFDDF